MRANELRIGNIIRFSEDGTIFTVDSIEQQGLSVQNEKEIAWINLDEFEPIPITADWLFRFRFVYYPHLSEFHGKNMIFHNWIKDRGYISWGSTQIKYVHQLQNLYFALTGEELTEGG